MNWIRVLHGLNGILFLAIGVMFLFWTQLYASKLGIGFTSAQGLTDFRATYGGMCLAIGLCFLFPLFGWMPLSAASLLGLCLYLALAITRIVGMVLDGSSTSLLWFLFSCECLLSLGCGIAFFQRD